MNTHLKFLFTSAVTLALVACNQETSPDGINYVAEDAATQLPADLGRQLDAAWKRTQQSGCVKADVPKVWSFVINNGVITGNGGAKYWGITTPDAYQTELTMLLGRVPAAAHEMLHAALYLQTGDADNGHTNPCFHKLDGDTQD